MTHIPHNAQIDKIELLVTGSTLPTASFDISDFQQGNLEIFFHLKIRDDGVAAGLQMRFNDDSSSVYNYINRRWDGVGTTDSQVSGIDQDHFSFNLIMGDPTDRTGRFDAGYISMPGFKFTNSYKTFNCVASDLQGDTNTAMLQVTTHGQWKSMAAVTKIDLYGPSSANGFVTGSYFVVRRI